MTDASVPGKIDFGRLPHIPKGTVIVIRFKENRREGLRWLDKLIRDNHVHIIGRESALFRDSLVNGYWAEQNRTFKLVATGLFSINYFRNQLEQVLESLEVTVPTAKSSAPTPTPRRISSSSTSPASIPKPGPPPGRRAAKPS
jgi:hypothetical protein